MYYYCSFSLRSDDGNPENINGDYMQEMKLQPSIKRNDGFGDDAQSVEDKLITKAHSEVMQDKSLQKKNSLGILNSFEGGGVRAQSQNSNQLKKIAITKNILNRLKETKVGGLEGIMPATTTKTPFNFSAKSNINSFYKRTAFISSFNRDDSLSLSHHDTSGIIPGSHLRKISNAADQESVKNQNFHEFIKGQKVEESERNQRGKAYKEGEVEEDAGPEDVPTFQFNEFFKDKQTLTQKVKNLNTKTYKFINSMQHHSMMVAPQK